MENRGPTITAAEVAKRVWEGFVSVKWVIQYMAPEIGFKPGKPWLFHENEARAWREEWIRTHRRRAV
jgi:hypothetical protein